MLIGSDTPGDRRPPHSDRRRRVSRPSFSASPIYRPTRHCRTTIADISVLPLTVLLRLLLPLYSFPSHLPPTANMSVTTTANPATYNLQSVLAEYDLHHTEETHDPSLNAHPNPNTSAQNPSHWPTDHRRIPPHRPINTALDQSERRVYLNTGEQVFVGIMFTGVFLESVSSGLRG